MNRIRIPIISAIVSILCVCCLGGCSDGTSETFPPGSMPYRIYSSDYNDFSIRLPRAWTLAYNTDNLAVKATSELEGAADTFRESIGVGVRRYEREYTLEEFHVIRAGELALSVNSLQVMAEGYTEFDGRRVRVLEYICHLRDGSTEYRQDYEIVEGYRGYYVTCRATPETYAQFRDLFAEISYTLDISYKEEPEVEPEP